MSVGIEWGPLIGTSCAETMQLEGCVCDRYLRPSDLFSATQVEWDSAQALRSKQVDCAGWIRWTGSAARGPSRAAGERRARTTSRAFADGSACAAYGAEALSRAETVGVEQGIGRGAQNLVHSKRALRKSFLRSTASQRTAEREAAESNANPSRSCSPARRRPASTPLQTIRSIQDLYSASERSSAGVPEAIAHAEFGVHRAQVRRFPSASALVDLYAARGLLPNAAHARRPAHSRTALRVRPTARKLSLGLCERNRSASSKAPGAGRGTSCIRNAVRSARAAAERRARMTSRAFADGAAERKRSAPSKARGAERGTSCIRSDELFAKAKLRPTSAEAGIERESLPNAPLVLPSPPSTRSCPSRCKRLAGLVQRGSAAVPGWTAPAGFGANARGQQREARRWKPRAHDVSAFADGSACAACGASAVPRRTSANGRVRARDWARGAEPRATSASRAERTPTRSAKPQQPPNRPSAAFPRSRTLPAPSIQRRPLASLESPLLIHPGHAAPLPVWRPFRVGWSSLRVGRFAGMISEAEAGWD
ncbi:hypothetical protein B0H15DRAFT_944437 [Mycena belliarum]|uniref:Uncharacterized protein n=1 Tax=Mycena belliarum TaxID=1033014 RepID=A0AAD6XW14_9AGAR|nr:hypothetical protein B0H15DRAFT_944437 [Mycena belliae]